MGRNQNDVDMPTFAIKFKYKSTGEGMSVMCRCSFLMPRISISSQHVKLTNKLYQFGDLFKQQKLFFPLSVSCQCHCCSVIRTRLSKYGLFGNVGRRKPVFSKKNMTAKKKKTQKTHKIAGTISFGQNEPKWRCCTTLHVEKTKQRMSAQTPQAWCWRSADLCLFCRHRP